MSKHYVSKLGAIVLTLFVFGIALAGEMVPFKGRGSGMVVGANPQPTYLELTVAATGQATHLGRFSRLEVLQIHGGGVLTGTIDFTAANGDVVSVSIAGQFVSPTTAVGTYTVAGGTGRFAGATGSAAFVAQTPDGLHVSFEFNGVISK